jgi:hypothetical protein
MSLIGRGVGHVLALLRFRFGILGYCMVGLEVKVGENNTCKPPLFSMQPTDMICAIAAGGISRRKARGD